MLSKREKSAIKQLVMEDDYYPVNAYSFVISGMSYAMSMKRMSTQKQETDLSAKELVDGVMEYALIQFGFLASAVFRYWRIQAGTDVGKIVYALIRKKIFAANKGDDIRDFECRHDIPLHLQEMYELRARDCGK